MPNPISRKELEALLTAKNKIIKDADFSKTKVKGLSFDNVTFDRCGFADCKWPGMSFRGATIKGSYSYKTDFAKADFTGATIIGSLLDVNFSGAKFCKALLKDTELGDNFTGADFTDADATKLTVITANLERAIFVRTRLQKAKVWNCKVAGADFTGADVTGVDWDETDFSKAKGLAEKKKGKDAASDDLVSVSTEGTPIIVIASEDAAKWTGTDGDCERACEPEDVVTVAGWIETGSIPFAKKRALVLGGETDTVMISTDDGCVLVRGAGGEEDAASLRKAIAKVSAKAWKRHAHPMVLKSGGIFMFDAARKGAAKIKDIDVDFGAVSGSPGPGTYDVAIADGKRDEPLVFVRLKRRV